MAPEVVSRRIYGKGCDVWGAGKQKSINTEPPTTSQVDWDNQRTIRATLNSCLSVSISTHTHRYHVACSINGPPTIFGLGQEVARNHQSWPHCGKFPIRFSLQSPLFYFCMPEPQMFSVCDCDRTGNFPDCNWMINNGHWKPHLNWFSDFLFSFCLLNSMINY